MRKILWLEVEQMDAGYGWGALCARLSVIGRHRGLDMIKPGQRVRWHKWEDNEECRWRLLDEMHFASEGNGGV